VGTELNLALKVKCDNDGDAKNTLFHRTHPKIFPNNEIVLSSRIYFLGVSLNFWASSVLILKLQTQ
jgi:hypothetical protein